MAALFDLKSLETFVWVATLGGFRAAAAKLNATQPAISQRVASLEAQCGETLLERGPRGAVPTEKGRALLGYAKRLLDLHGEMRAALARDGAIEGTLRLGVAETIVHTWLPLLIERLAREHPRLALEIEVDISPHLRERLLSHQIDLAFLLGPLSAPALRNVALGKFELAFLASPKMGLPRRAPLARLAEHPIVTFARGTKPQIALAELFAQRGLAPLRLHASAALSPAIKLALDGIAVALMPPAIVREELRAKRLVRIASDADLPDLEFVACWPAAPGELRAARVAELAAQTASSTRSASSAPPIRASRAPATSGTRTDRARRGSSGAARVPAKR
jgi:DNA-binding transcriptional LysR family regulator